MDISTPSPSPTSPSSSSTPLIITAVVVILLLAAVAGLAWYMWPSTVAENEEISPSPLVQTEPTPTPAIEEEVNDLTDELDTIDLGDLDEEFEDIDNDLKAL